MYVPYVFCLVGLGGVDMIALYLWPFWLKKYKAVRSFNAECLESKPAATVWLKWLPRWGFAS